MLIDIDWIKIFGCFVLLFWIDHSLKYFHKESRSPKFFVNGVQCFCFNCGNTGIKLLYNYDTSLFPFCSYNCRDEIIVTLENPSKKVVEASESDKKERLSK